MVSLSILNDSFDPKSPWWVVLLSIAVTLLGATVVWQGSLMVLLYFLHPLKQQEQHQHETNLATTAAEGRVIEEVDASMLASRHDGHDHDNHSSLHSSGASSDGTPEPSEHKLHDTITTDDDVAERLAFAELEQKVKSKHQQKKEKQAQHGRRLIVVAWPARLSKRDLLAVPPGQGSAEKQQQTVTIGKHDVYGYYTNQDDGDVCCCY